VAPFFFGMHINSPNSPFPSSAGVPIAGVRLWDTRSSWATTETGSGSYAWANLDFRVNQALSNNPPADVLYDLARTPGWAQCISGTCRCGGSGIAACMNDYVAPDSCAYSTTPGDTTPGDCYPPSDLNADGTGADQIWINWVTAVATRYKGQISYYEIWNEPNIDEMWQGSYAQLVRMAGDARCVIVGDKGCNSHSSYSKKGIDPAAKMLTPAFTYPVTNLSPYSTTSVNGASGSGATFADIYAFHGYPGPGNPPENVVSDYTTVVGIMSQQGVSLPVFNTEGSWGANNGVSNLTDPDQQAAFTSRYLLVQESAGVERLYWYGWDLASGDGTLWDGGLTTAGVSFQQTEAWVSGATLSAPGCEGNGNVWTCLYTRSGGYTGLVVWDVSQTCNNGLCTTSSFTVPSSAEYTQYQDVAGNTHNISGETVPIGAKPILLETGNIP
jgi:hypothetical protein